MTEITEEQWRRYQELQRQVWRIEESRPTSTSRWGLKVWMGDQVAKAEYDRALKEWEDQHPGFDALRSELEALRERVEASIEARRKRTAEAEAAAVLSQVPRVRDLVIRATRGGGFEDTQALIVTGEWWKTGSWCLLLLGDVGCGKTTAAALHAYKNKLDAAERRERFDVVWVRAVEAARAEAFGADAEKRVREWRAAHLLVLDDLGTEFIGPMWQQTLDDVLDARYERTARTIIITNLSAEDFKARYGQRIVDRIRAEGRVWTVAGKSLRGAAT